MKHRITLLAVLITSILFTAVVSAGGGVYAVGYVSERTMGMLNIESALGAPDGASATKVPEEWSQITLDMGAEITGPLIIYSDSYAETFKILDVATGPSALESDSQGTFVASLGGSLYRPASPFRYVMIWDGWDRPEGFGIDAVYAGPVLTIANKTVTVKPSPRGNTYTVVVTVTDTLGSPVTKAVVSADWTTLTGTASATAITRRGGEAKFTFKGEASQLCVTGMSHASIPYAADSWIDPCISMP